jgi:menaquinone-9 beta-reductase
MVGKSPLTDTEVTIIGAGPSGAIAAQRLASAGVRVTLLDKATFPRDKSCGDGLTADGIQILERTGLTEWLEQFTRIDVLRLSGPDGKYCDIELTPAHGFGNGRVIPRLLLDARLVQAAVDAGATLKEGVRVRQVETDTGRGPIRVTANGLNISADLVILADGSHAPITRSLGLVNKNPDLVAIRQYLIGDTGPANRIEIHFQQWILPGYSWLFPTGDGRVNIGTGTSTQRVHNKDTNLNQVLARFTEDPILEGRLQHAETDGPVRGHPLRTQFGSTRTHAERIMVIGDAAGLISPFTGEGIAPGMHSAELAAQHALAALSTGDLSSNRLAAYSQALRQDFKANHRAARLLQKSVNSPALLNFLFGRMRRDPELALIVARIIVAQKSPTEAFKVRTILHTLLGK